MYFDVCGDLPGAMEAATMADRLTARQTYYDLIDASLGVKRSP